MLEAPWLCPRPSPGNPKKIKDSHITAFLATLGAPPSPRQLQRKTTRSPALTAGLDGWVVAIALAKTAWIVSLGGLKDGAKFPALPWGKQKSSPAWVLLCLCHHRTGENALQPPAVSFMKRSMESRKIRESAWHHSGSEIVSSAYFDYILKFS